MAEPGPYTQAGIQLAQQGRKAEALPYLRRAVTSEPITVDVWLWLAHVSPDIQEYRNCVYQALRLQPDHPTAQRMQSDLDYQSQGMSPPAQASRQMHSLEQRSSRQRRWRSILILLIVILLTGLCGRTAMLVLEEEGLTLRDLVASVSQTLFTSDEGQHLTFSVGQDALTFQVKVPDTWKLADEGSASWREKRDELEREFPSTTDGESRWASFESNHSKVQFIGDTATPDRQVAIVETDIIKIRRDPEHPAHLSLASISTLPGAEESCSALEQLETQQLPRYRENVGFVKSEVLRRDDDTCIHYAEYREAITETHQWTIYVPMTVQGMMIWQLTVPEVLYDDYKATVEIILESLRYLER